MSKPDRFTGTCEYCNLQFHDQFFYNAVQQLDIHIALEHKDKLTELANITQHTRNVRNTNVKEE